MEEKIKEILINLIDEIDYGYAAFISPEAARDYANNYADKIMEAIEK